MPGFLREHSGPVAFSVLLHGLLVAALVLVTFITHQRTSPSVQPLPMDAVVVDSQVFHAAQRVQAERVAQEAARVQAAADAATAAAAAAEAKAATDAAAAAKAVDDAKAADEAKATEEAQAARTAADNQQQAEAQKAAAAQQAADAQRRADAEKAADAEYEAQRAAAVKKMLEVKQAAAARQAADAKKAADASQAADAKRAADDRARKDREAELRRQMADEEHVSAVESGPLRDRYIALLRNRIQGAWIKPPSASAGVDCMVQVTQVPGGEVTGARVTQCNGDAAVRQSIENAVYRASPLPDPPDPALFERNFVFRFRPNE